MNFLLDYYPAVNPSKVAIKSMKNLYAALGNNGFSRVYSGDKFEWYILYLLPEEAHTVLPEKLLIAVKQELQNVFPKEISIIGIRFRPEVEATFGKRATFYLNAANFLARQFFAFSTDR